MDLPMATSVAPKFVVGQKDKINFNQNFLEQIVATDFFLFRN